MCVVRFCPYKGIEEVRIVDRRVDQRRRVPEEVHSVRCRQQEPEPDAIAGEQTHHPGRTEQIDAAVHRENHARHAGAAPQA